MTPRGSRSTLLAATLAVTLVAGCSGSPGPLRMARARMEAQSADEWFLAGDAGKAAAHYRAALRSLGYGGGWEAEDLRLHSELFLVRCYVAGDNRRSVRRLVDRIRREYPRNVGTLREVARILEGPDTGNVNRQTLAFAEEAASLHRAILRLEPNAAGSIHFLMKRAIAEGNPAQALLLYERFLLGEPPSTNARTPTEADIDTVIRARAPGDTPSLVRCAGEALGRMGFYEAEGHLYASRLQARPDPRTKELLRDFAARESSPPEHW